MTKQAADFRGADIIDSRDLIEAATEIREYEADEVGDDEIAILAFCEDMERNGPADWAYGEVFIAESHFEDYARELARDIGAVSGDEGWPHNRIDWETAADDLKMDYSTAELFGTTYLFRDS
jgi:antirestriction protein